MHDDQYYRGIGFKCGLEIHQRLATKEKLFCSCATDCENDAGSGKVSRRQRAVAGELGELDRSTSFESSRARGFVYNMFENASCLVDIDEEPPHRANPEAVESALRFASAFNLKVPDEIEPMRKEVVDGSDPSAFQRSMLVGFDGSIEANGRSIPITSMFLEEESSGIASSTPDTVFYNVDRLGIPLIEVDTDPSISNPKEAKEVALKIGLILRLTGRKDGSSAASEVKRGIGTIRQDVNVSIAGGTRVEVKGLQEIDSVDMLIDNEVERQLKLIEIKKELAAKHASVDAAPMDITSLMSGAKGRIIRDATSQGGVVIGMRLHGFAGVLGREINPDRRLGSEISDYARMAGVKGIIHSDEDMGRYEISADTASRIREALGAGDDDAFIMVAAERVAAERAMGFAVWRARMAITGVPPETRAVADSKKGTTRFMRPLPGGSRLYPETDSIPIPISRGYYESIRGSTSYMDERTARIKAEIGNQQLAEQMISSTRLPLYEYVTSRVKGVNLVAATILLEKLKELERSGAAVDLDKDVMADLFARYSKGEITKAAIGELVKLSPRSADDTGRMIREKSLARISGDRLRDMVRHLKPADRGAAIRDVMSKHRLNVDGDELSAIMGSL